MPSRAEPLAQRLVQPSPRSGDGARRPAGRRLSRCARCASSAAISASMPGAAARRHGQRLERPVAAAAASDSAPATSARARSAAAPRSALVTTIRCGISTMPAFMNCSESPEPGWTQNTTVSATPATSVSDWPTPTVSISTRSNSARITHHGGQRLVGQPAQPVARRHRAHEDCPRRRESWTMRTRSPSSAPPLALDEGSTAITPTVLPSLRQAATSAAHSEDLPTPGGPVTPTTCACGCAPRRVEQACEPSLSGSRSSAASAEASARLPPSRSASRRHSVLSGPPRAACAAASRAIGTR